MVADRMSYLEERFRKNEDKLAMNKFAEFDSQKRGLNVDSARKCLEMEASYL